MDFFYTTARQKKDQIFHLMNSFFTNTKIKLELDSPTVGLIFTTPSPYVGLQPYRATEDLILVCGDPLLENIKNLSKYKATHPNNFRTKQIADIWSFSLSKTLLPNHPSTLVKFKLHDKRLDFISDIWGAFPIYYANDNGELYLASNPDLIAAVLQKPIDNVSASEFLINDQICFPFTLYTDVFQLPPASIGRFVGAELSSRFWFEIPESTTYTTQAAVADAVTDTMSRFLRRIRHQISDHCQIAFSGGLDSRFVANVGKQDASLNISAVTLLAAKNDEWIRARNAAQQMEIPLSYVTRRVDHYADALLHSPINYSSQVSWNDAHFHRRALGSLKSSTVVLGGYMSDTILVDGSPISERRRAAIGSRRIPEGAPIWMLDEQAWRLSPNVQAILDERYRCALETLAPFMHGALDTQFMFPITRQGDFCHFLCARQNYPMYEPFLNPELFAIFFSVPKWLKYQSTKDAFLQNGLPKINFGERTVKSPFYERAARKYLPKSFLPNSWKYKGPWSAAPGSLHRIYAEKRDKEFYRIKEQFAPDISDRIPFRDRCFQLASVMEMTKRKN